MRLLIPFLLILAESGASQVRAQRDSTSLFSESPWYSSIELRHHINTYYDEDGYLREQEPSVHARAQIGLQLYKGIVDAYTTLGVYKEPETQQLKQRRPEIAVDVHAVRSKYLSVMQYNIVQPPFEEREQEPAADVDGTQAGMIYTFGVAPTLHYPMTWLNSKWSFRVGWDGWTKFYSRPQYTDEFEEEPVDDGLALNRTDEADQEIEDFAMHYQSHTLFGFDVKPAFLPSLKIQPTANHNSTFRPVYTRTARGTDFRYGTDRYSYYRIRLQYEINERLSLVNDFYHFHQGFFTAKRKGDDRRFRNIARITCRL